MSQIDELLDTAFHAYNLNDFEQAEEIVREVLTLSPTNGDGLYLLGLIAYRANAFEPAEKLLYQAVHLYPENKSYATALASVLQKEGRLDEALSFYEPYQETDSLVLSQVGFIYLQKGRDDFALSAFDKALTLDKNNINAFIGKALLQRKNQQNKEALHLLLEARKINITAELMYQLSIQYRFDNQLSKALDSIKEALSLEQLASFYNEKGLILEEMGDIEEAQKAYEKAIEIDSYFPDSFANLANIYYRKEMFSKAEENYKRALGLDNQFLNAHHNLASLLYKQDRKTESLEHYRSALLINPHHISSLYNLGIILEEMGDYTEAAGLYFNILALKSTPPYIDFRIASTLTALSEEGKKEKKQAIDFAKGWVKHFPENVIAKHTLASLTGTKIDPEQSLKYAEVLYDSFAPTYEQTMEKIQSRVLEIINKNLPIDSYQTVLDLGCGTGSFGNSVQKTFHTLIGVDISKEMLKKTAKKNVYTELIHKDALSFLKTSSIKFDLIVAAELLCYLPVVSELIKEVSAHLIEKGVFVLTIEETQEKEILLAGNGRYLHQFSYIEKQLNENHLFLQKRIQTPLRKEGKNFAMGSILFCTKETPQVTENLKNL